MRTPSKPLNTKLSILNPPPHSHNLRSLSGSKTSAAKTLNLKRHNPHHSNGNVAPVRSFKEETKSESSPEPKGYFATEKINLPRGKVIRTSRSSSANGSMRNNSNSPVKLPRTLVLQEPSYQEKTDYYKEYWKLYFQNESLISDIEGTARQNYKDFKKIYNLEDYYEHYLIPQLLTYPHKFVHRLR
jgi:hypothetical protein